ncbi:hypothetical protein HON22_03055 [Candidatus Peregrinibacteria bacterium]|jgi:hypothetical protein|nr:hypothetical protein [Candidatus Peregrinibacteria bacterium]
MNTKNLNEALKTPSIEDDLKEAKKEAKKKDYKEEQEALKNRKTKDLEDSLISSYDFTESGNPQITIGVDGINRLIKKILELNINTKQKEAYTRDPLANYETNKEVDTKKSLEILHEFRKQESLTFTVNPGNEMVNISTLSQTTGELNSKLLEVYHEENIEFKAQCFYDYLQSEDAKNLEASGLNSKVYNFLETIHSDINKRRKGVKKEILKKDLEAAKKIFAPNKKKRLTGLTIKLTEAAIFNDLNMHTNKTAKEMEHRMFAVPPVANEGIAYKKSVNS